MHLLTNDTSCGLGGVLEWKKASTPAVLGRMFDAIIVVVSIVHLHRDLRKIMGAHAGNRQVLDAVFGRCVGRYGRFAEVITAAE